MTCYKSRPEFLSLSFSGCQSSQSQDKGPLSQRPEDCQNLQEPAEKFGLQPSGVLRVHPGKTGVDGIDSLDGADGVDGIDGIEGLESLDGIDGLNSLVGVDGIGSVDGVDGVNGVWHEMLNKKFLIIIQIPTSSCRMCSLPRNT